MAKESEKTLLDIFEISDINDIINIVKNTLITKALKEATTAETWTDEDMAKAIDPEELKKTPGVDPGGKIYIQAAAVASIDKAFIEEMLVELTEDVLLDTGISVQALIAIKNASKQKSKVMSGKKYKALPENKKTLKLNDGEKLYIETMKVVAKSVFQPQADINLTELETLFDNDDIVNAFGKSSILISDDFSVSLNDLLGSKQRDLSSGYIVDTDTTVYLTEKSKIGRFLTDLGMLNPEDPNWAVEKYGLGGEFTNNVNQFWPEIEAAMRLDEASKQNPNFTLGSGDAIQGIANNESAFSWIGTVVGAEAGPRYAATFPMSKEDYAIYKSEIPFEDFENFKTTTSTFSGAKDAVTDILDKQFGLNPDSVTASDKEHLAKLIRTNSPKLTFDKYVELNGEVGNYLFGTDDFVEDMYPDLQTRKETKDIVDNKTGYEEAFIKFLNPEGLSINQALKNLDVANPGQSNVLQTQFENAITNYLNKNPNKGLTAQEAGQKVLETMGVTPEGNLKPYPKFYDNTIEEELEESTKEIIDPQKIHPQYAWEGSYNKIKAEKELEEELPPLQSPLEQQFLKAMMNASPSQILGGAAGAIPEVPKHLFGTANLPEGDPGGSLPGFGGTIPLPVYQDQDVWNMLSNRYYDRPEFLQFLQPQIVDIAQQFRLSQVPGPEVWGEPEDLGPGDPGYTSSSARLSYFEKDKPKTMNEFFSRQAPEYERQFGQTRFFTQEQERIEEDKYQRDQKNRERRRKKLVSNPLTIFGRRRR